LQSTETSPEVGPVIEAERGDVFWSAENSVVPRPLDCVDDIQPGHVDAGYCRNVADDGADELSRFIDCVDADGGESAGVDAWAAWRALLADIFERRRLLIFWQAGSWGP